MGGGLSSIPGPYPLYARSTPVMTTMGTWPSMLRGQERTGSSWLRPIFLESFLDGTQVCSALCVIRTCSSACICPEIEVFILPSPLMWAGAGMSVGLRLLSTTASFVTPSNPPHPSLLSCQLPHNNISRCHSPFICLYASTVHFFYL